MNASPCFAPLVSDDDLSAVLPVIRDSFRTVADAMGLTIENAPSNPAFLRFEALRAAVDKGLRLYGASLDGRLAGCVGIEDSGGNGVFYLERLAVLPAFRHRGLGRALMDFACAEIRAAGGTSVSIAIVDENAVLKAWYVAYGFAETGLKRFEHLPFAVRFLAKGLG